MAKEPTIRFNPETGKIEESVVQEPQEDSFQTDLEAAQKRLETANKEVVLAQEGVDFQVARKVAFDRATQARNEANGSEEVEVPVHVAEEATV